MKIDIYGNLVLLICIITSPIWYPFVLLYDKFIKPIYKKKELDYLKSLDIDKIDNIYDLGKILNRDFNDADLSIYVCYSETIDKFYLKERYINNNQQRENLFDNIDDLLKYCKNTFYKQIIREKKIDSILEKINIKR